MNFFLLVKNIVVIITAVFLFPGNLFSQINNPFEIKSRLDSVRQVIIENNQDSAATSGVTRLFSADPFQKENSGAKNDVINPFDVNHTPLSKTVGKVKSKTVENQSDLPVRSNSFLFWILIFALALFAIVINIKSNLIKSVFRSAYNLNLLKLFQREEAGISAFVLLLYLIYAIEFSSWIFTVSSREFAFNPNINLWLIFFVFIICVYTIRHFFLFLLGFIYDIEKATSLYSLQIALFNIIIGIILIPFNFLISFGPEIMQDAFVLISIIMVGLLYLSRIVLTFFTGAEFLSNRIFQFIVYLCLFEIAPMWILIQELKTLTI